MLRSVHQMEPQIGGPKSWWAKDRFLIPECAISGFAF